MSVNRVEHEKLFLRIIHTLFEMLQGVTDLACLQDDTLGWQRGVRRGVCLDTKIDERLGQTRSEWGPVQHPSPVLPGGLVLCFALNGALHRVDVYRHCFQNHIKDYRC